MKRALYALGAIALGVLMLMGCNRESADAVRIIDAPVQDWTNPEDGKTYIVVAPTWTNEGELPIRELELVVQLMGPKGQFPREGDIDSTTPTLLYRGDPIDPGTTFRPSDSQDTFVVIGEKDAVLEVTGPDPTATVWVARASSGLSSPESHEEPKRP